MKAKSILMMSLITAGSFTSPVSAQDVSMERVVGSFVNQAMVNTVHDLELGVQQAVASTTHLFVLSNDNVVGRVKVTELASTGSTSAKSNSAKTERQKVVSATHD